MTSNEDKRQNDIRGITSKIKGGFYCLNCLHFFKAKANLDIMKEYVERKIFVK